MGREGTSVGCKWTVVLHTACSGQELIRLGAICGRVGPLGNALL